MVTVSLRQLGARATRTLVRRWSEHLGQTGDGWAALTGELNKWRGKQARIWWRDDDAVCGTPQLQRLLDTGERLGIAPSLAVIPADTGSDLAEALQSRPNISVLAHGWSHQNHAAAGTPGAELAAGRDPQEVYSELSQGRLRMEDLFEHRFLPVQVPPHNIIAPELVGTVRRAGFTYISIDRDFTGLPMPNRNTHIDVIDWGRKCAADPDQVVRSAVGALKLRRYGLVDAELPIGILTHHLVHDAETWSLLESLLGCLLGHPAVSFPAAGEIFR